MLTLSQAAKRTGKSKSVVSRALNNGDLTALKNDDGTFAINEDDLFSLWPERPEQAAGNAQVEVQNRQEREERHLRELLDLKTEQIDELKNHITTLKTQLDKAENTAESRVENLTQLLIAKEQSLQTQGTLLIEHQKTQKKGFFGLW